jgi:hypothetical protein
VAAPRTEPLPRDAQLVELRTDRLTLETKRRLLPGTPVALRLVLEGQPLPLTMPVAECLVLRREAFGYVYHLRLSFDELAEADRHLLGLFIAKGRGAPGLARP